MDAMITLGDAGLIAIAIALLILISYCISLVRNLIPGVKTLNRILEDTEKITQAAAEGTEEARKVIANVGQSVSVISGALKGKEGFLEGLTSLFKSLASLIGLLKK